MDVIKRSFRYLFPLYVVMGLLIGAAIARAEEGVPRDWSFSITYCTEHVCERRWNKTFEWPEKLESLGECHNMAMVAEQVLRAQGKKIVDNRCEEWQDG